MKKSKPYKGQDFSKEVILTKPNESMELEDILERFIRHEPLQIGHDVSYFESDEDIEKLRHLDPVDKMKYIRAMEHIAETYEKETADNVAELQKAEREKFIQDHKQAWEKEYREKGGKAPEKADPADKAK